MKDRAWETVNTVAGYGGIGVFVAALLMYMDGRIGPIFAALMALLGLLVNGAAVVSELMRSDDSREWLREVMNQAMIGNFGEVKKLLRQGER